MPSLEVDTAGVRYVACPSPRADDPCIEPPSSQWLSLAPGVVIDHDTFYDTLGVPSAVDLGGGHVVRTTATISDLRSRDPECRCSTRGRRPLGTMIRLLGADVPDGDFNTIAWDDGVDRDLGGDQTWNGVAQVASPGGKSCTPSMFSVDTAFDPAAWRAAGRTAEGLRVLVPVAVGNERSRAVRAWHEADSWTWDGDTGQDVTETVVCAETGFGTDQAFLAANGLFVVERPDGQRVLGTIPTAASPVFECAGAVTRVRMRSAAPRTPRGLVWKVCHARCDRPST